MSRNEIVHNKRLWTMCTEKTIKFILTFSHELLQLFSRLQVVFGFSTVSFIIKFVPLKSISQWTFRSFVAQLMHFQLIIIDHLTNIWCRVAIIWFLFMFISKRFFILSCAAVWRPTSQPKPLWVLATIALTLLAGKVVHYGRLCASYLLLLFNGTVASRDRRQRLAKPLKQRTRSWKPFVSR